MIFDDAVRKAVDETAGAVAGMIMARDGIVLSHYMKPEGGLDLETLGIEYANLLSEIVRHTEAMNAGSIKELSLATDRFTTIIRVLNSEYFIALIMGQEGNQGKGRFLLRVSAPSVVKEL